MANNPVGILDRCRLILQVAFLASALLATALQVVPARAQDAGESRVGAIIERGYVVVAMTRFDNPPFYSGDGDAIEGIDVAFARSLGEALGVDVVFDRQATSFDDVVRRVTEGDADIAISKLSRTYRRTAQVAYTQPYVRLRQALAFNRLRFAQLAEGRDIAEVVRSFDGRLGVINHSSFAGFARQRFPHAKVIAYASWDQVVAAAIEGKVDAAYRDEFEIRKIAVDNRDATLKLRTVAISDASDAIAMAVSWDAPRLLAIANQVIDNTPQKMTVKDLIDRYRMSVDVAPGG